MYQTDISPLISKSLKNCFNLFCLAITELKFSILVQCTGRDQLYPDDCGRDDNNKGNLCFPDGLLCQNSKIRTSHQNLSFLKRIVLKFVQDLNSLLDIKLSY